MQKGYKHAHGGTELLGEPRGAPSLPSCPSLPLWGAEAVPSAPSEPGGEARKGGWGMGDGGVVPWQTEGLPASSLAFRHGARGSPAPPVIIGPLPGGEGGGLSRSLRLPFPLSLMRLGGAQLKGGGGKTTLESGLCSARFAS